MEKEDGKAAKIITNDFKQLARFSVDLKAVEFSSLINEISEVCMVAREFGPKEGISDQNFRKSIEKTFLQIQNFLNEEWRVRIISFFLIILYFILTMPIFEDKIRVRLNSNAAYCLKFSTKHSNSFKLFRIEK